MFQVARRGKVHETSEEGTRQVERGWDEMAQRGGTSARIQQGRGRRSLRNRLYYATSLLSRRSSRGGHTRRSQSFAGVWPGWRARRLTGILHRNRESTSSTTTSRRETARPLARRTLTSSFLSRCVPPLLSSLSHPAANLCSPTYSFTASWPVAPTPSSTRSSSAACTCPRSTAPLSLSRASPARPPSPTRSSRPPRPSSPSPP